MSGCKYGKRYCGENLIISNENRIESEREIKLCKEFRERDVATIGREFFSAAKNES